MRFLLVAARELRSAARQKATFRVRWITATLFFGLLVWLLWALGGFTNKSAIPRVFRVYSVLTLLYCLFISTVRTADSISVERREGTLALLFLANLNSIEIIFGKLFSSALASVYGLMAIFPMMAVPLLMGGISFGNFGRTLLALLSGIFSALAVGFLASVVCKRQFTAIAMALGLSLFLGVGLMLGAALANAYVPTRTLGGWLADFSPIHTLMAADDITRRVGAGSFWRSAGTVTSTSLGSLMLTTLLLARTWRDRPKRHGARNRLSFSRSSSQPHFARRTALRGRMLAINPLFWLAAPKPVSSPIFMVVAVAITTLTVYVAAPYFGRVLPGGVSSPVLGHLFAWLCTGLTIHALTLYYAANTASQRLAEDKQAGALELILSTPTSEKTIAHGLWLAYARKLMFPAVLAVLVHLFFLWQLMQMAVLDPPGQILPGTKPSELFWSALLDRPLNGGMLEWQFGFMLRITLLVLLQLMIAWVTLGWVGRWLGLRMRHPGFAPMTSVALLVVPPTLLFSLCCYLADKLNFYHLPERRFLPIMMSLAAVIALAHCLGLCLWASICLRQRLRPIAMSRYQPLPPWRWHLPSRRALVRVAIASGGFAAAVTLLVLTYYGYQNWRGKREWKLFQNSLQQAGESVHISQLLAEPAPDHLNFARSPAFLGFLRNTNPEVRDLFARMRAFDLPASFYGGSTILLDWARQTNSSLHPFQNWTRQPSTVGTPSDRVEDAAAVLKSLELQRASLQELADAAGRLSAFQISTNRDFNAVLHPPHESIRLLERLHLLFQLRACALLATGREQEAAADVLAGLHLARLARQLPDVSATVRTQGMLTRSLQPLWEGLSRNSWTESELAAFQRELGDFNFLADYTNAVRRIVWSHIDVWCAIPDSGNREVALPEPGGGYVQDSAWQLQPRAWWYENCIQLYNAGRNAIEQVDASEGRVKLANNWADLNGLPLDSPSTELLQQSLWWGANPAAVGFVQTSVNQAIIACALARFRLANGRYPETLQKLVPAFLDRVPRDAVSGRPMIYETGGNGSFVLRGVGPNGSDDRKSSSSDDWLWTY